MGGSNVGIIRRGKSEIEMKREAREREKGGVGIYR